MSPIVISKVFDSPVENVWHALTALDALHSWYFKVQDYKLEVGNTFTFYESETSSKYLHKCTILGIIPNTSISYTWEHPTISTGSSVVTWRIDKVDEAKTMVSLTHEGVESFNDAGPDFSAANYETGWGAIIGSSLRNYLYGIAKLTFNIDMLASKAEVWKTLWNKESYKVWTNVFCAGSYYSGDINLGARVHFLSGNGSGMYSDVAFLKVETIVAFKHIGAVKGFEEMPLDVDAEKWTGCYEIYRLTEVDGITTLAVEVDVIGSHVDYMQEKFPLAMEQVKLLSEAG